MAQYNLKYPLKIFLPAIDKSSPLVYNKVMIKEIPMNELRSYIKACQCPFCKNGKAYKVLALHIAQKHLISRHEFREMAGLNSGSSICDPDYSQQCATRFTNLSDGFLFFNRAITAKTRRKEWRAEGKENRLKAANRPERKVAFRKAIENLDWKAIAAKIPHGKRVEICRIGGIALRDKLGKQGVKKHMEYIRGLRTPESEKIRIANAQKTMNKYRQNDEWHAKWLVATTIGNQKHAKLSISDYENIKRLRQDGKSCSQIATMYNVSISRIYQIISD